MKNSRADTVWQRITRDLHAKSLDMRNGSTKGIVHSQIAAKKSLYCLRECSVRNLGILKK